MVLRLIVPLAIFGFVYGDEPQRIVGASDAADGEFPYAVSIRVNGGHFCGGAIISPEHILTAAHCIAPLVSNPSMQVQIVTGSNYLGYGGQFHDVSRYFYHPQYDENIRTTGINWYYDIGVIKLAALMQFNAKQRPVQLPTSPPPINHMAVISAWGSTAAPPHSRVSQVLQKLSLQVIPYSTCQQYFDNVNFDIQIQDIMICTFRQVNMGTCSGDSGSPLAFNNEVVGVVSGGIPCARGMPDIFTNVFKFVGLVRQWMAS